MKLKQIWSNVKKRFRSNREIKENKSKINIKDESTTKFSADNQEQIHIPDKHQPTDGMTAPANEKKEFAEKIQESIGKLIEKLGVIENILNAQVIEQRKFIEHLNRMPELIKTFAAAAENQQRSQAQLSEQIRAMVSRDEQFLEAIEQIPQEEARQTETLSEIKKRLSISAETEAKMAECFRTFNETLKKLDADTAGQADSILQMSKTFATSDKYLRYVMGVQNKRFLWLFVISMGVCLVSVLTLAGIIIYLSV